MASLKETELGQLLVSSPPPILPCQEAANQTFKKGDLVYITGGYCTVCSTDPTSIYGIAQEDAHNTTAGKYKVNVLILTAFTIIKMCVWSSSTDHYYIEATDEGTSYGVVKDSAGKWVVDKTDTTNTRVTIIKFYDAVGTVYGQVGVVFLPAYRVVA